MREDADLEDRPRLRGALHAFVAIAAVPAGVWLVLSAQGVSEVVVKAVYAVSVFATFATSASYHRVAQSRRARLGMQRLDHAMIFVLIAGTYTPLCILSMSTRSGVPLLIGVWLVAIVGFILKLTAFDRYRLLNVALYPVLGWAAIIGLPALYRQLTTTELMLLIAGGVIYTAGIPVLERERPDPWPSTFGYHEIWHTFTVVAALLHFTLIAMLHRR